MTGLADDLKQMRHRIQKIKDTFKNVGTIDAEDLEFLCERTLGHGTLAHIAEGDWIRLKTLEVTSTLEIQDLVQQLEGK